MAGLSWLSAPGGLPDEVQVPVSRGEFVNAHHDRVTSSRRIASFDSKIGIKTEVPESCVTES